MRGKMVREEESKRGEVGKGIREECLCEKGFTEEGFSEEWRLVKI